MTEQCHLPPATYLKLSSPGIAGHAIFFLRSRTDEYAILGNDTRMAFLRSDQVLITDRAPAADPHAPLRAYGRLFPRDDGEGAYFIGYTGLLIPTLRLVGPDKAPLLEIADPIEEDEDGVRNHVTVSASLYGPEADIILTMLEIPEAKRCRPRAVA